MYTKRLLCLLLALAPLCGACSGGSQGSPQAAQPAPEASSATPEEQHDAATNAEPVGGEATKTGEAPKESKLTEEGKIDINAQIKEHREALTLCYDTPLSKITVGPDGFLVKAAFTIEASGRVSGARVVEATERFADAESCFLMELATIAFPPPPEGRVIEASYPFTIKRKGN
jgi:hypothetical protein